MFSEIFHPLLFASKKIYSSNERRRRSFLLPQLGPTLTSADIFSACVCNPTFSPTSRERESYVFNNNLLPTKISHWEVKGGIPILFKVTILIFGYKTGACKIADHLDNPFWEKSNRVRKKKEESKNFINTCHDISTCTPKASTRAYLSVSSKENISAQFI